MYQICTCSTPAANYLYTTLFITGTGSVPPKGYDSAEFPQVGGSSLCPYCFCTPCVISLPPNFLEGSSAPHIRNQSKRFTLYKHFWGLLKDVGVWRHPPYLERKERRTSIDDAREVMPKCVVEVGVQVYTSTKVDQIMHGLSLLILSTGDQEEVP